MTHSPDHAERAAQQMLADRGRFPSGGDVPFDVALSLIAAALRGRDRVVEALEKIAAFEPKPIRGTVSEQSAALDWNRAREWAARVAASGLATRATLHDAKEAGDGCPYTTAPRREGDEWACRCGKRWPVGEEHP